MMNMNDSIVKTALKINETDSWLTDPFVVLMRYFLLPLLVYWLVASNLSSIVDDWMNGDTRRLDNERYERLYADMLRDWNDEGRAKG